MERRRRLIVLWVTGTCQLSCKYCYATHRSSEKMEESVAFAALQLFEKEPLTVQFAGGEPLLNWELIEAVTEYVEKQRPGTRLQLQTNGISMDRQKADYIREHKIATGVSLDGIPEVNERLRGRTAEAVAGIRTLGEAGVYVNLNAVVTSVNVQKLPQLVDFAWYLESVAGIGLDLLRAAGRGEEAFAQLRADGAELVQALWKMEERSRMLERLSGRKIVLREIDEAARRKRVGKRLPYCFASCGNAVAVLPNGDCYPCGSLAGRPEYYMGNVMDQVRFLRLEPDGAFADPEKCATCPGRLVCPGACPSRRILNGETEEDCAMRRTAFQIVEKNDV